MKEYIFSNDDLYAVDMRRFDELKELIRCKDCKYHGEQYGAGYCIKDERYEWYDEDFCSKAERKEE